MSVDVTGKLVLKKLDDPRDSLEKARRVDLVRFAREHGVTEIVENMPAMLMRNILRKKGLTNIRIKPVMLGAAPGLNSAPVVPGQDAPRVDSTSDLMKQWERDQAAEAARAEKPTAPVVKTEPPKRRTNEITEVRQQLKRLGVPLKRTDRLPDLKAKLREALENGQDAAERG